MPEGVKGRVYANWNQLGSVAGRTSCSGPNLQQVPRDPRYRRCFVAPPGRVLVKGDYSQLQLRIAARLQTMDGRWISSRYIMAIRASPVDEGDPQDQRPVGPLVHQVIAETECEGPVHWLAVVKTQEEADAYALKLITLLGAPVPLPPEMGLVGPGFHRCYTAWFVGSTPESSRSRSDALIKYFFCAAGSTSKALPEVLYIV
jgi:hypothetical protein